VSEELVVLGKVAAAAVVACLAVLLLLGPPRPCSVIKCGGPEECRLVGEWMVGVFAQVVEAAFLTVAAVAAATAIAAALSYLRERRGEKKTRLSRGW
jgi:ABC-type Na+ efflux pump permease subunit